MLLFGGQGDVETATEIANALPSEHTTNLAGKTSLAELVTQLAECNAVLTNDTGPMHLIALAGCPSLVLFSAASEPAQTAPRGSAVDILQRPTLADLSVDDVLARLNPR